MKNYYDVVIVGAGPAGSSAAYEMAGNGLNVAMMERGKKPGDKNVYGGTFYRRTCQEVFPDFWKDAPWERKVITDEVWFLEKESGVKVGYMDLLFGYPPHNKFTALRPKVDAWMADKATEQGAELHLNTLITDLLFEKSIFNKKKKVRGVKLHDGKEVEAGVVVLTEGVNAPLTEKAGLRSKFPSHIFTLHSSETLALPPEKIESRFHLEKDEGAVIGFAGNQMSTVTGKGGIWTNKDTINITVGGTLNELVEKNVAPEYLLKRFKSHPLIKRLIEGAEVLEYKGKMTVKGGYKYMPKLYDDGVLVAGDAAMMVKGRRGTDIAMLSGKEAGETITQAKAKNDFSKKMLANYEHRLNKTFYLKDIKSKKQVINYLKQHQDADHLITSLVNELAHEFFTEDQKTSKEEQKTLLKILSKKQLPFKSLEDLIQAIRYWSFA
ncbi:FAD-dependent oxidoreductase [Natranaerofaba carboxydovora]|uniref:FAD-dependent oxidoreductase n=1 Tax=Natranaerofaba carboxydovora TaxID=2742683 RepID=UPI001F13A8A5|nr:FAD-dependent oxidoreductase [Natranaerofaba carboxydovora]UMZ75329.1 Electron transfer flavoprotein-ubiquinone oxidoreductase [Natranaerofaba carboxydovora]